MNRRIHSGKGLHRRISYTLTALLLLWSQSLSQQQVSTVTVGSLDSAAFANVRLNGKISLIEFGGRNCIPCRQMQPILGDLSAKYARTMNIFNIYMDSERDLFREHRITLIPTQIIFDKSGKEIARHVGFWGKDSLVEELKGLRVLP